MSLDGDTLCCSLSFMVQNISESCAKTLFGDFYSEDMLNGFGTSHSAPVPSHSQSGLVFRPAQPLHLLAHALEVTRIPL